MSSRFYLNCHDGEFRVNIKTHLGGGGVFHDYETLKQGEKR